MGTIRLSFIFLVIMGVTLGGFYFYFNWSQNKIQTLEGNNAKITAAVEEQKKTIDSLQTFYKKQNDNIIELQNSLQQANDEKAQLENKFLKHDLEALARKDPKAIELRINKATIKAFRDIETFTGAHNVVSKPSKTCTSKKNKAKCVSAGN